MQQWEGVSAPTLKPQGSHRSCWTLTLGMELRWMALQMLSAD